MELITKQFKPVLEAAEWLEEMEKRARAEASDRARVASFAQSLLVGSVVVMQYLPTEELEPTTRGKTTEKVRATRPSCYPVPDEGSKTLVMGHRRATKRTFMGALSGYPEVNWNEAYIAEFASIGDALEGVERRRIELDEDILFPKKVNDGMNERLARYSDELLLIATTHELRFPVEKVSVDTLE